jgi:hypothetical protein
MVLIKKLIVKSLLSSLYQREGRNPSFVKRGKGRFFNNDSLHLHASVKVWRD